MKLASAQALVEAAQESGLEVRLHETYSGRGMGGHTTAAVSLDNGDLFAVIAVAAGNVKDREADDDPAVSFDEFVDDMRRLGQDTMGRGGCIIY